MTANGSPGNRNGFQQWVDSLQRPPGSTPQGDQSDAKAVTAPLVDESATHVHQIPKEIIHRLRERENQGLLGVEAERTAVFKPPPELLARAKRNQQKQQPPPTQEPAAAEKTKPPPPEAAVPTVRPPPGVDLLALEPEASSPAAPAPAVPSPLSAPRMPDDFADLEAGLDALKPIAPRALAPRKNSGAPVTSPVSRAQVSAPVSSKQEGRASNPGPQYLPGTNARMATPMGPFAALSALGGAAASVPAPSSRPGGAPSSSRSGVVSVPASDGSRASSAGPSAPLPAVDPDSLVVDEPTILRIVPSSAKPKRLGDAFHAPEADDTAHFPSRPELPTVIDEDPEPTGERLAGVSELEALNPAPLAEASPRGDHTPHVSDSLAPEAAEGRSGRQWVVIAALFCVLVAVALAWLRRGH